LKEDTEGWGSDEKKSILHGTGQIAILWNAWLCEQKPEGNGQKKKEFGGKSLREFVLGETESLEKLATFGGGGAQCYGSQETNSFLTIGGRKGSLL